MSRKNILLFIVMLLLGGIIFGCSLRRVNGKQLQKSLFLLKWKWVLVAILAMMIYLFLEAVIVKIMIDSKKDSISWYNAIRVPLVEQFGNGITPFASGGQPMQLIALVQTGVDIGRAGSVLLMKFVVYQGMIVVNFLLALIIGFKYLTIKVHQMTLIVVLGFLIHLIVVTLLLLVMYSPIFTHHLATLCLKPVHWFSEKYYKKWNEKIQSKIDNFHEESLRMGRDFTILSKVIIITLIQLLFYYSIPYFILLAVGQKNINLIFVMSLHVLIVMVISLFPIPGGAGGAEVGFSMLFSSFLPNSGVLVLAMLIWRIITYYFGLFAGIIAFSLPVQKNKY